MAAFRKSGTSASVGLTALALLGLRSDTDVSAQQSGGNHSTLDLLSGVEAMCETVIALTIAAAISIGLVSLSAHLDEAKTLRQAGATSVANAGPAQTTSHYN
jgi:hypothetical protein